MPDDQDFKPIPTSTGVTTDRVHATVYGVVKESLGRWATTLGEGIPITKVVALIVTDWHNASRGGRIETVTIPREDLIAILGRDTGVREWHRNNTLDAIERKQVDDATKYQTPWSKPSSTEATL